MLLAGAGCFALRFGIVTLVDRRPLPTWFEPATAFVIPGSLAGLCTVLLIAPITSGGTGPALGVAAATTAVVARRRSPIDEVERILVTSNERDDVLAGVVPNHG